MTDNRIAAICSSALFIGLVALGLAGADKPPPPMFLGFVALLAAIASLVYVRLRAYLSKRRARTARLAVRAAVEGLVAGLVLVAVLTLAGGGEPSVSPSLASTATGFAVGGTVGAVLAAATYAVAAWMQRRSRS